MEEDPQQSEIRRRAHRTERRRERRRKSRREKRQKRKRQRPAAAAKITRVVREDGSGTTDRSRNSSTSCPRARPRDRRRKRGAQDGEKALNTTWPNEATDPVARGKGGGGAGVKRSSRPKAASATRTSLTPARTATSIPSSEEARARKRHRWPGTATFWAEVENGKGHIRQPGHQRREENPRKLELQRNRILEFGKRETLPAPGDGGTLERRRSALTQKHYSICA